MTQLLVHLPAELGHVLLGEGEGQPQSQELAVLWGGGKGLKLRGQTAGFPPPPERYKKYRNSQIFGDLGANTWVPPIYEGWVEGLRSFGGGGGKGGK